MAISDKAAGQLEAALASRAASEELKTLLNNSRKGPHGASFTIGAEVANARTINIQLTDINGDDLAEVGVVTVLVLADSAAAALATTGGSTGISAGTDGFIAATVVAKKVFLCVTEPDGDLDLVWTDTGTEAVYLGIVLANGTLAVSSVIQNA